MIAIDIMRECHKLNRFVYNAEIKCKQCGHGGDRLPKKGFDNGKLEKIVKRHHLFVA